MATYSSYRMLPAERQGDLTPGTDAKNAAIFDPCMPGFGLEDADLCSANTPFEVHAATFSGQYS
jgi:hypothetical protein